MSGLSEYKGVMVYTELAHALRAVDADARVGMIAVAFANATVLEMCDGNLFLFRGKPPFTSFSSLNSAHWMRRVEWVRCAQKALEILDLKRCEDWADLVRQVAVAVEPHAGLGDVLVALAALPSNMTDVQS